MFGNTLIFLGLNFRESNVTGLCELFGALLSGVRYYKQVYVKNKVYYDHILYVGFDNCTDMSDRTSDPVDRGYIVRDGGAS